MVLCTPIGSKNTLRKSGSIYFGDAYPAVRTSNSKEICDFIPKQNQIPRKLIFKTLKRRCRNFNQNDYKIRKFCNMKLLPKRTYTLKHNLLDKRKEL